MRTQTRAVVPGADASELGLCILETKQKARISVQSLEVVQDRMVVMPYSPALHVSSFTCVHCAPSFLLLVQRAHSVLNSLQNMADSKQVGMKYNLFCGLTSVAVLVALHPSVSI